MRLNLAVAATTLRICIQTSGHIAWTARRFLFTVATVVGASGNRASFALNAMIEGDRVTQLGRDPETVNTPSNSGSGQLIARCPRCKVAVWSNYAGAGPVVKFVRVGTLDNPDLLPPDIHIFTASKQPWVVLPSDAPAVPEYYDREVFWPPSSLARRSAILPLIEAYQRSK